MAEKTKTREITIIDDIGTFGVFFKRFTGEREYDFEGISSFRKLLTNEKARIMHILKTKKPGSIYALAKLVQRDFKSVNDDVRLLERFGFVEMLAEKTGKRARLKPVLVIDSMHINIKI